MAEIRGSGDAGQPRRITTEDKEKYQSEYKQGADLFQKALEQYAKSDNMYQKGEFKDVMDNMMQVLNDTARALKATNLEEQNKKIAQDYAKYTKNPSQHNETKLSKDLDQAKHSI